MRRITIEWDKDAIEHIWRHRVEPEEVEESLQERYIFRRGHGGTYYVFGRSEGGRYVFVVLSRKSSGYYGVVAARDMTPTEQRFFRKKGK